MDSFFFLPVLKSLFMVVVSRFLDRQKNVESIKMHFPKFDFSFAKATIHIFYKLHFLSFFQIGN